MHLCLISTSVNIFDFYFTILSLFKFQHPFISLLNWFRRLIMCFFPTFNVTSYTFLHLSKLFPLLPLYANLHLLLGFFSPSIYALNSPPFSLSFSPSLLRNTLITPSTLLPPPTLLFVYSPSFIPSSFLHSPTASTRAVFLLNTSIHSSLFLHFFVASHLNSFFPFAYRYLHLFMH